jgi:nucleotidyltransferase/DNA polymerase involved in DNA repair
MKIVKKYSPIWEIVSLDEAYLDISFLRSYKKAEGLAKKLKQEIFKKERLTSTCGIGPNKLIAKIASQKAKPNGLLMIKPAEVQEFLDPLDIEEIPGIGPKTAGILRNLGINKIKDLKKLKKPKLKEIFGRVGEDIYNKVRGIDESEVLAEEIIKSIGKEHTFEKDTREPEIIFSTFEKIIKEVWQEIQKENFLVSGVSVRCRFRGFETKSRQKIFPQKNSDFEFFQKFAKKLLLELLLKNKKLVRLVGLRVKVAQRD